MRAALNVLADPRRRALASARLRAWWDGQNFDEAQAQALIAERFQAQAAETPSPPDPADLEKHLFGPAADPRLEALQLLWGAGRIAPASEEAMAAVLGADAQGRLALMGPGLSAAAAGFAGPGRDLSVYEWRSETRAALEAGLADLAVAGKAELLDLDVTTLPPEAFDGVASFDEFTYAANPTRLALQIARTLKSGAKAVIETYAGAPGGDLAPAFASAFAEPQIHAQAALVHALTEAGLDIEIDDDITHTHAAAARAAFERFPEAMAARPALGAAQMRELGWETQTWRARLKLLTSGRLQRRRFRAHRRA